ncbi:YfhD family protein [Paenibacillus alba]|uniref:YfhD family protein n=1 Tax=Paenibacillus alba TaxID=1197127 RepID=A0ABU6GEI9_9BACL|nr:YfhD family protein [Paenibacillus alba]MEC0232641.1 YfhD family protein [Paenibacillus alba]NQX65364.1 YfhD family protein [Paenibacillus alba]
MSNINDEQDTHNGLPVVKNEDVEFAADAADRDDFEASERAAAADHRQEES